MIYLMKIERPVLTPETCALHENGRCIENGHTCTYNRKLRGGQKNCPLIEVSNDEFLSAVESVILGNVGSVEESRQSQLTKKLIEAGFTLNLSMEGPCVRVHVSTKDRHSAHVVYDENVLKGIEAISKKVGL